MSIRVVRLGTPRAPGEGLRIGTVRRPPRGVAKSNIAKRDFYDVWFPELSPSADLIAKGRSAVTDRDWAAFLKAYRTEMIQPAARHALELLAAPSHSTDLSVGCYCEDEARCHRSELGKLLAGAGAQITKGF
jgi:uncharacterized protein YeaO (DUF488 family)